MATIGRTVLRLTGALLLGASAVSIDNPGLLFAPTTGHNLEAARSSAVDIVGSTPEIRITPGKRAYAVRVGDAAKWGDLLQPNSRVDILVVAYDSGQRKRVARLLIENMRLLAVGAVPERTEDGRTIRTLIASIEVTPDEGERLAVAAAHGSIQLVLRGYGNPDSVSSRGAVVNPFVISR